MRNMHFKREEEEEEKNKRLDDTFYRTLIPLMISIYNHSKRERLGVCHSFAP